MSLLYWGAALVVLLIFIYLLSALFNAEDMS